jgi:hypothetical protein
MSGHSVLSPSSADRWTRCPGSVELCKDIPNPPNEASALGSAKHEAVYWALMHSFPGMMADGLKGQPWAHEGFAGEIDDEFIAHVNYCLDAVRAIPGSSRWFEIELDTSPVLGVPDQKGTGDVVIGDKVARVLNVGDHKFGYGYVDVEENRQMLLYAAAALHKFDEFGTDYDTVRLWVFQPKRGEPRMWETTAEHVRNAGEHFAEAAKLAMSTTGGGLNPGDKQCQWCPARANCKARATQVLTEFPIEDNPVPLSALSDAEVGQLLDKADAREAFWRDIRAEGLRRATAGKAIPGYKLIEGKRGNRRWIDVDVAAMELRALGIDPHEKPKLVSPTEAERRLKAAKQPYTEVAMLVEQPPGAPSLARWNEEGRPLPALEFGLEEVQ